MNILLYVDEDPAFAIRNAVAVALVRACGGHVHCLQATSPNALIASGSFGTAKMLAERAEEVEHRKRALEAETRTRMAATGISWDYRAFDGDVGQCVIEQSRLVDAIVFSAERQLSPLNNVIPSAGELLPRVRVPVFAVPARAGAFTPAGLVIVAWDGSPQCAFALHSALEPLRCASSILVLTVEGEKTEITAEQAAQYLAHHDLASAIVSVPAAGRSVSAALIEAVEDRRAAYVVMGAYGRGRARELLLGGVTREMLKSSPVPLLLAH
ncbi:universal stress protein [Pedomonas sp. V897]|uniref:universal stress protein n=1 Tax=Pedomonas sp. V897 TaxID=3446482 RepID=UPI003EE28679